ncbi:P-selectin glycoprotein ligand 1 [Oncorhynchus mykiss]|uniref:Selectin P ligand n=1 Tax=Oncorhynchus mykiss TaxID=8022 RepID=A0A8C7NIZ0_ONCMY|nr:P-selectin glycoprotein ligand 1 [Oncorhynchus mykiss]
MFTPKPGRYLALVFLLVLSSKAVSRCLLSHGEVATHGTQESNLSELPPQTTPPVALTKDLTKNAKEVSVTQQTMRTETSETDHETELSHTTVRVKQTPVPSALHPPNLTSAINSFTEGTAKSSIPGSVSVSNRVTCPTMTPKGRGLVGQCLIIMAVLAAVITMFIVSTVILLTKLRGSRYRHRAQQLQGQGTEMVCISAVVPTRTTYGGQGRYRCPTSNITLMPSTEDSEGDNLTLNSFIPDVDGCL